MAGTKDSGGEWLVVVNPNAGLRKAEKDWPKIAELLNDQKLRFRTVFTHHRGHAIQLTHQFLRSGFRKFIVVGGDGTLNELVNGIFTQDDVDPKETITAIIPVGTGNDWCRYHKIPDEYEEAVRVILRAEFMVQDVGLLKMREGERYFINMAGMGYDGLVAKKTNEQKDKGRGGPLSYMVNLVASLFSYKMVDATVVLDGQESSGRLFSLSVGICKYNGGGMMQAPDALPDDGLLDLTIIQRLSKLAVIRNVPKLFDGSFTRLPMVFTGQGKEIEIKVDGLFIETDGESVGKTPCTISILPQAVRLITGLQEGE